MVYVVFAEGFEEIEAITAVDVLRRADIEVKKVGLISQEVLGAHGIKIQMDGTLDQVDESDVQMIVLPGGMPGTKHLRESEALIDLLKRNAAKDVFLAAICAAPTVLHKANLLEGKAYTCYPGFEEEIKAGLYVDKPVVNDGKIITGRSAGSALAFALNLVEVLKGREYKNVVERQLVI